MTTNRKAEEPKPRKLFTVQEANDLLPTLRLLLAHLQAAYRRAQDRFHELELLKAVGKKEDGTLIMAYDYRLTKQAFERTVERVNHLVEKINATGVRLRHIELGLVDFPARIDGEEVLLCWQYGEDSVQYYHGPDEGFSGRKPIPQKLLETGNS